MHNKYWTKKSNDLIESTGSLNNLVINLAYLADVLCIWIINTPEISWKICWGRHSYNINKIRRQLENRLSEIRIKTKDSNNTTAINQPLFMNAPCYSGNDKAITLHRLMYSDLLTTINSQMQKTDIIMDEPTYVVLSYAYAEIKKLKKNVEEVFNELNGKKLGSAQYSKTRNIQLNHNYLNVPSLPAREKCLNFKKRKKEEENLTGFTTKLLHTNLINLEIATMECCASIILEYKNIPFQLYDDMIRQIWDEARHAEGCYFRLLQLGGKLGDYPSDLILWEMQKNKPLELRFAIHQRIGEWIGVDGAIWHQKKLKENGDTITSKIFEFIVADEITHVQFGNKWLKYLLKTEKNIHKVHQKALAVRKAYGKITDSFIFPFNPWVCNVTGFSGKDVKQMSTDFKKKGSQVPQLNP